MLTMLQHLSKGRPWYAHLRGRSEHAGGLRTLGALKQRGWIDSVGECDLTEAGKATLRSHGLDLESGDRIEAAVKAKDVEQRTSDHGRSSEWTTS
jgi:hypothetical protein